ncbi:Release factor glutamine methyltransferase [Weissella viridescens]|uniref:Release factor glutamine methyltransferase n=1 Tax=Weissella viridescens TaxID=1629 RepID=A0A380NY74_WEIVI|nr:Release factor glutamine methyltransferase [Weissella viridescens]
MIISNPPYIAEDERAVMDESVLNFEPDQALFAEDQGLAIYEAIAPELLAHLKPNGEAYFEIGYQQGPALVDLFSQLPATQVTLQQDMSGHDRMLKVARRG